jgi:glycerol transport system substrate-binding protein
LLGEGEVVQAVQTQMQTNRNLYDGYINDSDLIGTHSRLQSAINLTDWMAGEGKDVTDPMLDLDDFMGIKFTTGPDGKLWQLPDQQFANLYWFRKDWFDRQDLKDKFKAKYGYELGVPVNWSAYEDIADFFSNDVKEVDGVRVYGHMDYGKRAPDLGWRMTDAWLSMAGEADVGQPNGRPVDEWGHPHGEGLLQPGRGVGVARRRGQQPGGGLRGGEVGRVAAQYAPPGAADLDFYQSLPALAQGNVAQQIFWYTAFTANMVAPKSEGNNTVDDQGTPLWRMAPSPHGPYWKEGSQRGYQDVGSWTLFNSTPVDRRKAAWLYAQFVVSKTVDVKKSQVGLTFIRDSTVRHQSFTERAPKLGGMIEFYRSPDRVAWSPTGVNVPDYPKLAQLFWENIGDVNSGAFTAQQAMDRLAQQMDDVMARMQAVDESNHVYHDCGPRLNPEKDPSGWLSTEHAPWAKLDNEKPKGETVNYDDLVKRWTEHQ